MHDPKNDTTSTNDTVGEGNYEASRRYREGLEKSVAEGTSEELAKKAAEDLEGSEGQALRDAEKRAKNAETPGA